MKDLLEKDESKIINWERDSRERAERRENYGRPGQNLSTAK